MEMIAIFEQNSQYTCKVLKLMKSFFSRYIPKFLEK